MDKEKLKEALEHRNEKAGRKYLMKTAEELRELDKESYNSILKCRSWTGELQKVSKRCRIASAVNVVMVILALLIVAAAYILGDFGMRILTGWLNRYLISIAVLFAIGIVSLSTWISAKEKAILIGLALCEEEDEEAAE